MRKIQIKLQVFPKS